MDKKGLASVDKEKCHSNKWTNDQFRRKL